MFVPIWVFMVLVHLIFFALLMWATKEDGPYDFAAPMKFLGVLLLYAIFWIVWLLIRR